MSPLGSLRKMAVHVTYNLAHVPIIVVGEISGLSRFNFDDLAPTVMSLGLSNHRSSSLPDMLTASSKSARVCRWSSSVLLICFLSRLRLRTVIMCTARESFRLPRRLIVLPKGTPLIDAQAMQRSL
jgi:hypothetical protein